jgi:hypothetical protein
MTYYRVALQRDQAPTWRWASTVLNSLDGVFGFLRLYHMVPKDRIRVFCSSSVDYLNEMLARENQGLPSNSPTADQLFNGSKHIDPREMQRLESAGGPGQGMGMAATSLLGAQARHEQRQCVPDKGSTSVLERSRLAVEPDGSADHDAPYRFSLPASLPQVLAWTRLLARVQRGELEP